MRITCRTTLLLIFVLVCMPVFAQTKDALHEGFLNPPDDARPMMRWWWFGPAVTKPELKKELEIMRDAGIGGVEIQPVYPMAVDDAAKGIRNLQYLSPEFLDAVGFANRTARGLGMRVDITLGSGWPYGGPKTTVDLAAGKLRVVRVPLDGPEAGSGGPQLRPGDKIISVVDGSKLETELARRLELAVPDPNHPVNASKVYFIAGHTGQQVKRAAFGAEGNVLDHFSRAAIDEHLQDVAKPLLKAFGDEPPYSVFSDSLEVYGADWTENLPEEFRKRRGYDLIPHLPELVAGGTSEAEAVRHDWGKTLDELIRENYLTPLAEFAAAHHTQFRSQTYGDPAVTLADQDVPQLIEGEGMQWRKFSYTRWATSAAHLYGRDVVSAETWTWLHSPAFRATPLDVKAEADRMFLLGVNQFVGHGWPYSPESAGEPGYAFYAAAVFNQHNPWSPVMPDVMRYLTRASWLLRQGKPANDVAILLPEDDAQAAFTPGHVSIADEMEKRIPPRLMEEVLDAGYNVDFIDAATIEKLGTVPYPVLILPPVERIPLSAYRKIEAYAKAGGKVIAVGETPSRAPGLMEQGDSAEIQLISSRMFKGDGRTGSFLSSESELGAALHKALAPDLDVTGQTAGLGFIHRRLDDRDVYFVANTSNQAIDAKVRFRSDKRHVQTWDPEDGVVHGDVRVDGSQRLTLRLEPYESRVFVLSASSRPATPDKFLGPSLALVPVENLSRDWDVSFVGPHVYRGHLDSLVSWTRMPNHEFFSGEAVYTRNFSVQEPGNKVLLLDFGEGKAIADDRPAGADGMHALLDPPIREAAIVYMNGKRAGALWHPPYRLDITGLVHAGENRLEIHVFNTAMNELAGQPRQDLTELRAKYGNRFEPQDQEKIKPVDSGLLGAVRLMTAPVQ
ncbi:glycosyl hydrolase [Occallatibacter riparius]|uniref:Glycoside hydrolase n=1 Tax=Occallatibacter riparius TaxID=1002689 RepID=A0A9J7BN13_9BACT|nr:glycosyl hydrolase [Occallatibacter riparius]UWZ84112.1 glycoside hydrolase [Occallatibacter riparius]